MGLDTFLIGIRSFRDIYPIPVENEFEETKTLDTERLYIDPISLAEEQYYLAYWRRHWNLHEYIINTYGTVNDNMELDLEIEHIFDIMDAIVKDRLPHNEGTFADEGKPWDIERSILLLERAIIWLEEKGDKAFRSIKYLVSV